jgi:hypothetical protein
MTATSNDPTSTNDRLYQLLPVIYRQRDLDVGSPLRQLLSVITAQVDLVENDIAQLYDNWFIETCDDWVVPYIGDLIGYRPAGPIDPTIAPPNSKILSARREVANAIRFRRRKGSLWLLEQLAEAVTGWPARAVELGRLLGQTQSIDHLRLRRDGTIDIRSADALDRIASPLDTASHATDVRSITSDRSFGAFNADNVAVYVWRLPVFSSTRSTAYCQEEAGDHCYTFSILGNDSPLFTLPVSDPAPEDIAGELNLPVAIRRRALERRVVVGDVERIEASESYYGVGKSIAVWVGAGAAEPIAASKIIPADLSDWRFRAPHDHVALDPELGRLAFPPSQLPQDDVFVLYHYAFGMQIGGGEYARTLSIASDARIYRVGAGADFERIGDAYRRWRDDGGPHAIIELVDNGVYEEPLNFTIDAGKILEIRAANRMRPVIDLLDWRASRPDAFVVEGVTGSGLVLDGLLVTGRGLELHGRFDHVTIRDCTLVPGWSIHPDAKRRRPSEPSLSLMNASAARIEIARSIVGAIHAVQEDVTVDPVALHVRDSIVDATSEALPALGTSEGAVAPVTLTARRTTFFGQVHAHAIELAENSIFANPLRVARRQLGCMRYCYVAPHSRTPARYYCQPDLAEKAIVDSERSEALSQAERHVLRHAEQLRVAPRFISTHYGEPAYGRLALESSEEIRRGAEDRSELGVFHDLFEAQRAANLRGRLFDYVPAGTEVGIVFAS